MGPTLRRVGVFVALLVALTGVALGATYSEEVEFTISPSPGLHLTIETGNGGVSMRAWSGGQILVTATKSVTALTAGHARNVASQIKIETEQTEATAQIKVAFPRRLFVRQAVAFDILVPRDWIGQVSLKTSNGAIVVEGVNGDVHLWTSNGRIEVHDHAGRLTAHTSNGRIDLTQVDTALQATTSNGRITIREAVLRGNGEVRTSNGRITLEGTYHGTADYSIRSSNGTIELRLIPPVDLTLDARTSNGSVRLDGLEVRVTEVGKSALRGTVGAGGGTLVVRTSNGDITFSAR